MADPGDDPSPPQEYGITVRVTPDDSGDNPWKANSVLYSASSAGGSYSEVARNRGTSVWYYDDILTITEPRRYYKVGVTRLGYQDAALIGPVDAEPIDLESGAV